MYLSPHFSLAELTISQAAARNGLSNSPSDMVVLHLRHLAGVLEEVRALLGNHPLLVSSAYRSTMVNQLIGGVKNSAHCQGFAADFICPGYGPPVEVCKAIAQSAIAFDQVIYEFDSWCHFSVAPEMRRQVLRISDPVRGYENGLIA